MDVRKHSVSTLIFRSKKIRNLSRASQKKLPLTDFLYENINTKVRGKDTHDSVLHSITDNEIETSDPNSIVLSETELANCNNSLVVVVGNPGSRTTTSNIGTANVNRLTKKILPIVRPQWHAPWKLYKVISGHHSWVRCCAVEPQDQWFATGSEDGVIKIWNFADGSLKLTLTDHISSVRSLAISEKQIYLFSCGGDGQVKCWDLEYNKVVGHYQGHVSTVYSVALHPELNFFVTAGKDRTARVWDPRTKANVQTLTGHTNTVASVVCQDLNPQVITASHDCTIRLWNLVAGKSRATLTNHKKSVRAIIFHPVLNMFASASPNNIKQWHSGDGTFIQNLSGHNAVINCLSVNANGVLVSGGHNGSMHLWDWRTGYNFQCLEAPVQPGSSESEAGICSVTFDKSGSKMITTQTDNTIKMYKEDVTASEQSHPINWKLDMMKRRKY